MLKHATSKCLQSSLQALTSLKRQITYNQATSALRPFFFAVHPDFFTNTPTVCAVNENSLKTLNGYLEAVSRGNTSPPKLVTFYLRSAEHDSPKLVTFYLNRGSLRATVIDILSSCNFSTSQIEATTESHQKGESRVGDSQASMKDHDSWDLFIKQHSFHSSKVQSDLKQGLAVWFTNNVPSAQSFIMRNEPVNKEIDILIEKLKEELGLLDIDWRSEWGCVSYRGCLAALNRLLSSVSSSSEIKESLFGRRLVFTRRSGVSVLGDILLSSSDVPESWLSTFRRASSQLQKLETRIPPLERGVSVLLNGAQIRRLRQQHCLYLVDEYELHLKRMLRVLAGYIRSGDGSFLDKTDDTLEVAVDDTADNPSLTPEGIILLPSNNPAFLLVDFINHSLRENRVQEVRAEFLSSLSEWDRVRGDCEVTLKALSVTLDSNVSLDKGVSCCKAILEDPMNSGVGSLHSLNCHLKISTFYSVSGDGVLCIPWNWYV